MPSLISFSRSKRRVVLREDDAGAITLKTARNRAYKVKEMCAAGIPHPAIVPDRSVG